MFAGENVKITKNEFKSKIEETVGLGSNEHGYFDLDTKEQLKFDLCYHTKSNGDKFEFSGADYGSKEHFAARLNKPNGDYGYIEGYWADGAIDWIQAFAAHDGLAADVSLCKRYVTYSINGRLGDNTIKRYISVYDDSFLMTEGAGKEGLVSKTVSFDDGSIKVLRRKNRPEFAFPVADLEEAKKYAHQLLTHSRNIETRDKAIEHICAMFPRFKAFIDEYFYMCMENIIEADGKLIGERTSMDWFDSLIEDTIMSECNFPSKPKLLEKKDKTSKN